MNVHEDKLDGLIQKLLTIHDKLLHLTSLMDALSPSDESGDEPDDWCFGDVEGESFPPVSPDVSLTSPQFEPPSIYSRDDAPSTKLAESFTSPLKPKSSFVNPHPVPHQTSCCSHDAVPSDEDGEDVLSDSAEEDEDEEDASSGYVNDGWCVNDDENDARIAGDVISRIRDSREQHSRVVRDFQSSRPRRVIYDSDDDEPHPPLSTTAVPTSSALPKPTRASRANDHRHTRRLDRFAESDSDGSADVSEDLGDSDDDEDDDEDAEEDEDASFVVDDDEEKDLDWRTLMDADNSDADVGFVGTHRGDNSDDLENSDDDSYYKRDDKRAVMKPRRSVPTTPSTRKLPTATPGTLDKYRSRVRTPHRTTFEEDPYETLDNPYQPYAASPRPTVPAPTPRSAAKHARARAHDVLVIEGRTFAKQREELAQSLYNEFNARAFGGKLPADMEIKWSARLLTTAGQAVFKRIGTHTRTSHIVLSTKVLDDSVKLRNTLCHEMCHVAAWVVDGVMKPPHGGAFQQWARRAMTAYPDLDITTCHNYEIFYKHRYQCSNDSCRQEYGRHSKSIDIARARCHRCGSTLSYLGGFNRDGTPSKARAPSEYNKFVQENSARLRERHKGVTQQELMSLMAAEYKQHKSRQNTPAEKGGRAEGFAAGGVLVADADSDDDVDEMAALVKQLHF